MSIFSVDNFVDEISRILDIFSMLRDAANAKIFHFFIFIFISMAYVAFLKSTLISVALIESLYGRSLHIVPCAQLEH